MHSHFTGQLFKKHNKIDRTANQGYNLLHNKPTTQNTKINMHAKNKVYAQTVWPILSGVKRHHLVNIKTRETL